MSHDLATVNEASFTPTKTNNPLVDPNSYFRSKLFTVTHCLNPLVAAAAPLSTFTSRILNGDHNPETALNSLHYEIQAFEAQAKHQGYPSKTVLAARYLLCAWIDEVITNSAWGQKNRWHPQQLTKQTIPNELKSIDFFEILQATMQDPTVHIDLLELIYLFLALGYEGKYRSENRGHQTLAAIMDSLYQCINYQRGDHNRRLLSHIPRPSKPPPASTHRLLLILSACLVITLGIFFTFNYQLNRASLPILEVLSANQDTSHG